MDSERVHSRPFLADYYLYPYHRREDWIRAHVQLCRLALLLIRALENSTGNMWRNLRHEVERLHLVTLATTTTPGQKQIWDALELAEPRRFFDFQPALDQ